jgi:hypothetical protein
VRPSPITPSHPTFDSLKNSSSTLLLASRLRLDESLTAHSRWIYLETPCSLSATPQ